MSLRAKAQRQATAAAWAAAVAVFACVPAWGDEAARFRPTDGDKVVLVLPAALSLAVKETQLAGDPIAVAARAEEFIALARTTRDARYFGRAQALVAPWTGRPDAPARLLVAAADLAQQRHEFTQARQLLDRAIAAAPRDTAARLKRANVALLLGTFGDARRDCLAVIQAGDALPGTICLASSMTGPGSVARARRLLASLDGTGRPWLPIACWLLLTEGDLARRDGDLAAATDFLSRARALDPENEEARARLADVLIERGDDASALALAEGENVSAALLVARIRAASALNDIEAATARHDFDALLAVGRRRGTGAHLREEGALALYADQDANRALEIARRNFELQRDTPDLRLLLDSALATGDRPTLGFLRGWLAATGFEDRVAARRLAEAGA